jgi:3-hydroxyacyl-CoA dehydrogenase/enoyl-CoA hydratase/3-hydroxybutyryl-CoA epimerase
LGLGFPPFLGGPFRYMDALGAEQVVAMLEKWESKHGARFTPAGILKDMAAKKNGKFYM